MEQKERDNKILYIIAAVFLYYAVNTGIVLLGTEWTQRGLAHWNSEEKRYLETAVKMLGMFLSGMAVLPFYRRESKVSPQRECANVLNRKACMGIIIAGAVLAILGNSIISLAELADSSERYKEVAKAQFGLPLWYGICFYGVLSPVVEEVFFRGILYRFFRRQAGVWVAVIGSSLLFGGLHGNIVQAVYGSIMGVFLAFCYEKYEKLAAPVLFHGAANIAVYVLMSI